MIPIKVAYVVNAPQNPVAQRVELIGALCWVKFKMVKPKIPEPRLIAKIAQRWMKTCTYEQATAATHKGGANHLQTKVCVAVCGNFITPLISCLY